MSFSYTLMSRNAFFYLTKIYGYILKNDIADLFLTKKRKPRLEC